MENSPAISPISKLDLQIYSEVLQNKGSLKPFSSTHDHLFSLLNNISKTLVIKYSLETNGYEKYVISFSSGPGFFSSQIGSITASWEDLPQVVCAYFLHTVWPRLKASRSHNTKLLGNTE